MYQERAYQGQGQTQAQPPQPSYREWDERQQQRFPESRAAQYQSQYQPQYAQHDQQTNVGQTERQLSVVAGVALMLHAVITRSRASWITGPLGAALFWRGQTGRCPVYQAMNVNTAQPQGNWQGNGGGQSNRGWQGNVGVQQIPIQQQDNQQQSNRIEIQHSMTVNKPAEELYNFWRKLENLPKFMHHLEHVEQTGDKGSHWKAKLAGGIPVEWDAEIIEDVPGQRIAWRTKPDSQVQQSGVVEFKPATGGRGTIVHVDIRYTPPGGIIGETFGRLLNGVTTQQVNNDIARFKSLMETGEIPTTEGQPAGR